MWLRCIVAALSGDRPVIVVDHTQNALRFPALAYGKWLWLHMQSWADLLVNVWILPPPVFLFFGGERQRPPSVHIKWPRPAGCCVYTNKPDLPQSQLIPQGSVIRLLYLQSHPNSVLASKIDFFKPSSWLFSCLHVSANLLQLEISSC